MEFSYRARSADKKLLQGTIRAPSQRDAILSLKNEKDISAILSLRPNKPISKTIQAIKTKAYERFQKLRQKPLIIKSGQSELIRLLMENLKSQALEGKPTINVFIQQNEEPKPIDNPVSFKRKAKFKKPKDGIAIPWHEIKLGRSQKIKARVPLKEIQLFSQKMSTLLSSGVSLSKTLTIVQGQTKNKKFKEIIKSVYDDLYSGMSLSQAMAKFPNQFNDFYVATVSVGETSGTLDKCFSNLSESLRTQVKIRQKITNAAIYPIIIFAVLVIILILGSQFFIPHFAEIINDLGVEIPLITKIVFMVADYIIYAFVAIGVMSFLVSAAFRFSKSLYFAYVNLKDSLLFRVPILNNIISSLLMFNFSNTMAIMIQNGIRMLDGLTVAHDVVSNSIVKAEISDSMDLITSGASLSESLLQQEHFDPVICSMISTGEESGQLGDIFRKTSDYYSEQLKSQLEMAMEWMQPLAILVIAAVVIPVVIAIFLPILDISSGSFIMQ